MSFCDWPPHRDEPRCEREALLNEIDALRSIVRDVHAAFSPGEPMGGEIYAPNGLLTEGSYSFEFTADQIRAVRRAIEATLGDDGETRGARP